MKDLVCTTSAWEQTVSTKTIHVKSMPKTTTLVACKHISKGCATVIKENLASSAARLMSNLRTSVALCLFRGQMSRAVAPPGAARPGREFAGLRLQIGLVVPTPEG